MLYLFIHPCVTTLTKHSYHWNPGSIDTRMSAAVTSEQDDDRKHLFSKVPAGTACVHDMEPGPRTRIHRASVCHDGDCHCTVMRI